MRSPRSITVVESDPSTVDHYVMQALRHSDQINLFSRDYPITGGTTVFPIGSDGFLDGIALGTQIDLHLIERSAAAPGPDDTDQLVPGSPFTVHNITDGAETITVQL